MNDLITTSQIVKEILEKNEKARNSDNYLYYLVCETLAKSKGIDLNQISMPCFLMKMKEYGMPAFETVRRTRQKAQQDDPHLCANEKIEAERTLKEVEYRNFARGH